MVEERISLDVVKAEIKKLGADWLAGVTSISKRAPEDQKMMLGLVPSDQELKMVSQLGLDTELASKSFKFGEPEYESAKSIGIPSSIDWRRHGSKDWTTKIKNQGSCGSCVAFGTVATLEALLKIRCYKDANKDIDLSEAHLLWCGGGSCSGWNMDPACNYLKGNGVPDEACFPYQPKTMSCADTCSNWTGRIDHTKITNWTKTKDVNAMKTNLAENGPQITGMAVYQDFFSYKSGVYKHVSGSLAGYHCVSVVGYNDAGKYWICKNSWGTGWGESGWFRIAYGECGVDDVFGMWNMTVPQESGCGYATYVLVDYSCTSSSRILWAYAGGKWRYKYLSDAELSGIAKLVMEAKKVYVCWKDNKITFIRSWK